MHIIHYLFQSKQRSPYTRRSLSINQSILFCGPRDRIKFCTRPSVCLSVRPSRAKSCSQNLN